MTIHQTRRQFVQRTGASALALSSLGAILQACGGSDSGEQLSEGTVTLWSDVTEAEQKRYFEQNVVAPFQRENPGVKVDLIFQNPDELGRQVRLALQAEEAPDVIPTLGPAFVPELAEAGFLA